MQYFRNGSSDSFFPRRYGRFRVFQGILPFYEIAFLGENYQFWMTHCRSKVVEHEITSPLILEPSLYDDFPRKYGRFRVFQGIMSPPYFVMQYFRNGSSDTFENYMVSYTHMNLKCAPQPSHCHQNWPIGSRSKSVHFAISSNFVGHFLGNRYSE